MSDEEDEQLARAYFAAAKRKNVMIYTVAAIVLLLAGIVALILFAMNATDRGAPRAAVGGVALLVSGAGMAANAYRTARRPVPDPDLRRMPRDRF